MNGSVQIRNKKSACLFLFSSLIEVECTQSPPALNCVALATVFAFQCETTEEKSAQTRYAHRFDVGMMIWTCLMAWKKLIAWISSTFCEVRVFFLRFNTFATHARTQPHNFKFDTHNQKSICCCFSTHLLLSRQSCQMYFFASSLDWLIVCLCRVNCKI